jgi:hypothetical protein
LFNAPATLQGAPAFGKKRFEAAVDLSESLCDRLSLSEMLGQLFHPLAQLACTCRGFLQLPAEGSSFLVDGHKSGFASRRDCLDRVQRPSRELDGFVKNPPGLL